MEKVKFDPTINTGNIIAIIVLVAGLLGILVRIETTLVTYETKINNVERSMEEMKEELLWLRRNHYYSPRQPRQAPQYHHMPPPLNDTLLSPNTVIYTDEFPHSDDPFRNKLETDPMLRREERIYGSTLKAPKYL